MAFDPEGSFLPLLRLHISDQTPLGRMKSMEIGRSSLHHPPRSALPPLTIVPCPPNAAVGYIDGVILAYGGGSDWSRLEFSLLRDSRHDIACADIVWDWMEEGGVGREWDSRGGVLFKEEKALRQSVGRDGSEVSICEAI